MTVIGIVPNIATEQRDIPKTFYSEILGMTVDMDFGWTITFVETGQASPQIIVAEGGSDTPAPDLSIDPTHVSSRISRGEDVVNVPDGFAIVTPYIFVDGGEDYVRFLSAAFGAREIGRSMAPNGRIANCQMKFGTATIMVSEASEEFPASSAAFYLYVSDADVAMDKALKAGADNIMDTADMTYGDRQGGVRDPSGNIWWVSQRLTSEPYF